jgi:hypothetical protein
MLTGDRKAGGPSIGKENDEKCQQSVTISAGSAYLMPYSGKQTYYPVTSQNCGGIIEV